MVAYIRSDLDFILAQIKVAEKHAAYIANPLDPNAAPLYGVGLAGQAGSVPSYNLSIGLRTVDGQNNNLLPGQEKWGAADMQFPELLDPAFRPAENVPGNFLPPGAPAVPTSYAPSNNPGSMVFDSSLRTISNLIVDQTLGNPAAIMKGLQSGGIVEATLANVALVQAIYNAFKPALDAEYQARVVMQNAKAAANAAQRRRRLHRSRRGRTGGARRLRRGDGGARPHGSTIWKPRARSAMRASSRSGSRWTATTSRSPTSRRTSACRPRSIPGSLCSASSSITVWISSTRAAAAPCSFRCSRTIRCTCRAARPTSWC